jgi:hypothetical protein
MEPWEIFAVRLGKRCDRIRLLGNGMCPPVMRPWSERCYASA